MTVYWMSKKVSNLYYVDATNGNDSNSGHSPGLDWQTIAKVNASSFNPGDHILFKKGETWREELIVPSAGASGSPITLSSYGSGNAPKIYGSTIPSSWTQESALYYTAQAADPLYIWFIDTGGAIHNGNKEATKGELDAEYDWWFDDPNNRLYIYAASDPLTRYNSIEVTDLAIDRGVFWLENHHDYDVINGLETAFVTGVGIVVRNQSEIINSYAHHIGKVPAGNSYGAEIQGGINSRIAQNIIHDANASGIWLAASSDPYITSNNIIEHNEIYDCQNDMIAGHGEASTVEMSGNIIRFNKMYHTTGYSLGAGYGYGIRFYGIASHIVDLLDIYYNHISVQKAGVYLTEYVTNAEIYNNTIHSITSRGIFIPSTGTSGIKIKNNIIYVEGSLPCLSVASAASVSECDYNCYWNPAANPIMWHWDGTNYTKSQFATYQAASGMDAHSIVADPLFVDFANRDFHLQSGSPCRNSGVDVGLALDYDGITVPQGAAPDMGAYEYH